MIEQELGPRGQLPARREDRIHADLGAACTFEHQLEPAIGDIAREQERRCDGEAKAGERGLAQRGAVARGEVAAYGQHEWLLLRIAKPPLSALRDERVVQTVVADELERG